MHQAGKMITVVIVGVVVFGLGLWLALVSVARLLPTWDGAQRAGLAIAFGGLLGSAIVAFLNTRWRDDATSDRREPGEAAGSVNQRMTKVPQFNDGGIQLGNSRDVNIRVGGESMPGSDRRKRRG